MDRHSRLIVGLDVGVSSIRVLVVSQHLGDGKIKFLGFGRSQADGITKHGIHNVDQLSVSIKTAIAQAEKSCSERIDSVYFNIGSARFRAIPSRGLVSVSRADKRISEEDIKRVLQAARAVNLPANNEILGVQAKEFIIDGQEGTQEPLEMKGTQLEARVLLLTVFSPHLSKLKKAVENAGVEIEEIIATPLACSQAVLTEHQKQRGVAMIDIGAGLTKVSVFQNGCLVHAAIFALGSSRITDDISVGEQIEGEEAEQLKKDVGTCREKKEKIKGKDEKIKKQVAKIIRLRLDEILKEAQEEIYFVVKRADIPAGIVLTGSGSEIKGVVNQVKSIFKLTAKVGTPDQISDLPKNDPGLATVAGLVLADSSSMLPRKGFKDFLQKIFRIFVPNL